MKFYILAFASVLSIAACFAENSNKIGMCQHFHETIQILKACKDDKSCKTACRKIKQNEEKSKIANSSAYIMTGIPIFEFCGRSTFHTPGIYQLVISDIAEKYSEQCRIA